MGARWERFKEWLMGPPAPEPEPGQRCPACGRLRHERRTLADVDPYFHICHHSFHQGVAERSPLISIKTERDTHFSNAAMLGKALGLDGANFTPLQEGLIWSAFKDMHERLHAGEV